MALPYTPGQVALRRAEEDGRAALRDARRAAGRLLLAAQPARAGLRGHRRPAVAYVQLGGGALPVSLSTRCARSKARAPRDGGRGGAVPRRRRRLRHRPAARRWRARRPATTRWCARSAPASSAPATGSGTAAGGGRGGQRGGGARRPGDPRAAGLGRGSARASPRPLAPHAAVLEPACGRAVAVAWPARPRRAPPRSVSRGRRWLGGEACAGLPLSHMGRGPEDDPWFFAAAFAAGRLARWTLP